MSIRSMGMRSAVRLAQTIGAAPPGNVLGTVVLDPAAAGAMAGQGTPGAPPQQATPAPSPPIPTPSPSPPQAPANPIGRFTDSVTAWIPTETIALFVDFSGFFAVFDNASQEFALGVVAAGLTAVFAALSSLNAQSANGQLGPEGRTRTAATTAGLAVLAFVAWWAALPGSFATDELELAPFWPSLFVAVVSLCLPLVARAVKVEPVPRPV